MTNTQNNTLETTTEIWLDIPNHFYYQASNFGRIRSFKSNETYYLKMCIDKNGYRNVRMIADDNTVKTIHVHKIISELFLEKVEADYRICVDHIDRDKTNNHVNNLRFVSYSENQKNRKDNFDKVNYVYVKKDKPENCGVREIILKNGLNKFVATYSEKSKKVHIGTFETEQEAIQARKDFLAKK